MKGLLGESVFLGSQCRLLTLSRWDLVCFQAYHASAFAVAIGPALCQPGPFATHQIADHLHPESLGPLPLSVSVSGIWRLALSDWRL